MLLRAVLSAVPALLTYSMLAQSYIPSDSAEIQVALRATYFVESEDAERAMSIYDSLYQESIDKYYTVGAGRARLYKGIVLNNLGRYPEAIAHYYEALPFFNEARFDRGFASVHNNLGVTFNFKGELDSAATHYLLALERFEAIADTNAQLIGYGNVGGIFMEMEQWSKARTFFEKGLELATVFGDSLNMSPAYINMGYLSARSDLPDEAESFYMKSIEISEALGDYNSLYLAHNNLGDLYYHGEQKVPSLHHSKKAYEYARITDNPFFIANSSNNLGVRYAWVQQYDSATHYLQKATALATELGQKKMQADAALYLADAYAQQNDYEEAYKSVQQHLALLSELRPERQEQLINELETQYQTAQKDAELARQEVQVAEAEIRAARSRSYTILSLVALLFLAVVGTLFYRNSRHKSRLQAERLQRIEQEREMGQLKARLEGEERERRRLARELHDGIGGQLAMIRAQMKNGDSAEAVSGKLRSTDAEVRRIAHNLMPEILLKHGLKEALQSFADEMDGHPYPVHFEQLGPLHENVATEVSLATYRIAQELVKNAVKHAGPCSIFIQLLADGDALQLTVEDDGKGMPEVENALNKGIGLSSIQERLLALNGNIHVQSSPERGTSATVTIPLMTHQKQSVHD